MGQDNTQPKIVLNPKSGLVIKANTAACNYYGLVEEQIINQPLNDLGQIDFLTRLPNRKLFLDRVQQALLESQRAGKVMAVLFIDLDRFKPINDTLGHHAGDQVLKIVAKRLQGELRKEDTLARIGGDEFVVLLKSIKKLTGIERVADQMLKQLLKPFVLSEGEVNLGGSMGISIYPQDSHTVEGLLQKADLAMYRAKKNGRNQWSFFQSEMDIETQQRFKIERMIRKGIEKDLFEITFNPIFNTMDHKLYALETEISWGASNFGYKHEIEAILEVASKSYIGLNLCQWQVKRALMWLKEMVSSAPDLTLIISINPVFFRDKNIVEWIDYNVTKYNIDPQKLVLSLPPACLNIEMLDVTKRVTELTDTGIKVIVEEFGSQGASLFQLDSLGLSGIKLMDFNLSTALSQVNRRNEKLAAALLAFAGQLNSVIIVTGIATQEQLSFVQSQHCFLMQGLFFGEKIVEKDLELSVLQMNEKMYYLVSDDEDYDCYS